MINRNTLCEQDARSAMAAREFNEAIRGSSHLVAIILTQDWCPQWKSMQRWLSDTEGSEADEPDVDVWELEYNRFAYGDEFMRFKERVLSNRLIPYVRYYRDGTLVGESNFVGRERFFSYLTV